ncbi:ATP-binding cassette domain-containing protein, partial [Bacillus thuringiensis]|nr:ATP-binding cassette domain-containing protein [Bacillus thuringiensis]
VYYGDEARMTTVWQEPRFFRTTVKENMYFEEEGLENQLEKNIELVNVKPIIRGLSEGLQTVLHKSGEEFSGGGERKRLALLRAIVSNPNLIILDEPTNGLDPIVKRQILQFLVGEVAEKEITIFISTHHLDEVEQIADTIIILKGHTVSSITSLDDAKSQFAKIQVAYERSLPQKLENLSNIKILNQTGKVYTILIEGNVATTLEKFYKEQPILIEELTMSLEDVFVTTLEEDGYVS